MNQNLPIDKIIQGNTLDVLKTFPDESIDCCITSPPYWGLRDYGTAKWEGGDVNCNHHRDNKLTDDCITGHSNMDGMVGDGIYKDICKKCGAKRIDSQIGLERTPEEYVEKMVEIFREVKRVLKKDGTLWLNLGDSYNGGGRGGIGCDNASLKQSTNIGTLTMPKVILDPNLKPKDLCGIPWRVAFALQADGWYLRQDIIWHKPNPMPESVTDRCTKAHEYIFLLAKSRKYYFDNKAIKEDSIDPESLNGRRKRNDDQFTQTQSFNNYRKGFSKIENGHLYEKRNKRSVWAIEPNANYYVEFGGKFCKVSLDCPIHSPYLGHGISQNESYDEQQGQKVNDISDISKNLGREPICESAANLFPDGENPQIKPASYRVQNSQNIGGNKTLISDTAVSQNHRGNKDIQQKPACMNDVLSPDNKEIAILRNRQSRKNTSLKVLDGTASAEIPCHISDKLQSVSLYNPSQNISENNISADCASDEKGQNPLAQILSDSNCISYLNGNIAKCTCQEINVEHFANKPDVWKISTRSFSGAHFATFPEDLIKPMVLAGCPKGGLVLDPFMGAGTTGVVAKKLHRNYLGCELNPAYIKIAEKRLAETLINQEIFV